MNGAEILGLVNLFFAGLLAGEEFVVRFGVRGPVASLDVEPQIRLRRALIRRLMIVVPIIFFATLLSGIAATVLVGVGPGLIPRGAALLALLVWVGVTLGGTAPINSAAADWDPLAPPADWRKTVSRWERLDTVRTWAAVWAFALFLAGLAVRPLTR